MEIFLLWVGFSIVVGVLADRRHRSGGGWFLLACVISPLIAGLLVLVMAPGEDPDVKECPACAEEVKREALVCKHCGHTFDAAALEAERKAEEQQAAIAEEGNRTVVRVGLMIAAVFVVVVYVGNWLKDRSAAADKAYTAADVCLVARRLVIDDLSDRRARIEQTGCANLDLKVQDDRSWRAQGRAVVDGAAVTFTSVLKPPTYFREDWLICDLLYLGDAGISSRAPKC